MPAMCPTDVWDSYETLKTCLGFQESNMVVMIDTDKSYVQVRCRSLLLLRQQ